MVGMDSPEVLATVPTAATAESAPLDPGTGAVSTGGPEVGSELGASKGVTPTLAP